MTRLYVLKRSGLLQWGNHHPFPVNGRIIVAVGDTSSEPAWICSDPHESRLLAANRSHRYVALPYGYAHSSNMNLAKDGRYSNSN